MPRRYAFKRPATDEERVKKKLVTALQAAKEPRDVAALALAFAKVLEVQHSMQEGSYGEDIPTDTSPEEELRQ